MPRRDGEQLINRLDAHRLLEVVPVLVITAGTSAAPPEPIAVLRKPFEIAEFVEAVELHAAD
jgi:DNA-binding response OmpR family regulator